jgi:cytoskeleton protein RodZ
MESDLNDDRHEEGVENPTPENEEFRFQTVGEQLRGTREQQALSLSDVASRTRVPMRHLEAIERSDFAALPGTTYTVGFTKSYAKALGLDDVKLIEELRAELAQGGYQGNVARLPDYEPADPARVPPRWLAWSAAALAVALLVAYLFWRNMVFAPDATDAVAPKTVAEAPIAKAAPAGSASASAVDPSGEVVITATEAVWLKIYDAENKRLYENEMKAGDSFTVPADANNPMIVTGRPQVLNVTIGGKAVPALGTGERSIADVGVSAAALLSRKPAEPASQPDRAQAASGDRAAAEPR